METVKKEEWPWSLAIVAIYPVEVVCSLISWLFCIKRPMYICLSFIIIEGGMYHGRTI